MWRRQLLFACIAIPFLGGCSAVLDISVRSPDPDKVIKYVEAFEKFSNRRIERAEDYVYAGFAYIDHYCEAFFVELEIEKRRVAFAKSTTLQAFTTAPAIISLASDATKPGLILAQVSGLTNLIFEQYEKQFIFAQYSVQLRLKVLEAQHEFKNTRIPPEILAAPLGGAKFDRGSLASLYQAHQIVQQYARLCTIPQLELFIVTALDATAGTSQSSQRAFVTTVTPLRQRSSPGSSGSGAFSTPPFVSRAK
jgi:hypothetical protein